MPAEGARYAIGDLAGLAGATARTIRYYVAQGLLPAPAGVGPGAHYTDDHLARLRLIRRLQRQHQPLAEIRQRLASLGESEVSALVADEEVIEPPSGSALEYLRSVLAAPAAPPAPASAPTLAAALRVREPAVREMAAAPRAGAPRLARASEAASSVDPDGAPSEQRSQWDRIGLTPNIEIHVRRPLGRLENRRVERLITIARQLLREEQP
jgi:DNA-binding transcriptional MerR regulator